ncbi:hypothetical protein MN608_11528 [Microdochium nivale]|nr:hypothetical protein MN608_11528 [Microdochium nivale]
MVAIKSLLAVVATFGTMAAATAVVGSPCSFNPNHLQFDCGPDGQQSLLCGPDNKWQLQVTCKKPSVCPPGGGFCVNPVPFKV